MMWNSPAEFFAMGGYALYVWSSFGVCALIMVLEPWAIQRRRKAIVQRLKREMRAEKFDKEGMK
jgi:heme exporter protein D